MGRNGARGFILATLVLFSCMAYAGEPKSSVAKFPLQSLNGLEIVNIKAEVVEYRGRRAVRLLDPGSKDPAIDPEKESIAIVNGTDFKNGTIEAEIAGVPGEGAPADARGFVGIAFRVAAHGEKYECFYLRPTNGRAEDQLRRNHSVQYISAPDYPWKRLRTEHPGEYESYADLEAGAWTKIKIVVAGTRAKLYVNGAAEPCLVVNDLKLGDSRGQIALWTTAETDAYFSNLSIK